MFRSLIVVLLALGWVPLTSHCAIEALPGFEFLRCAADLHAAEDGADPCEDDGCCAIEFAKYQSPRQQDITPAALVLVLSADDFLLLLAQWIPAHETLHILTAGPPDLPTSWQFLQRTALPVRAPSVAS